MDGEAVQHNAVEEREEGGEEEGEGCRQEIECEEETERASAVELQMTIASQVEVMEEDMD